MPTTTNRQETSTSLASDQRWACLPCRGVYPSVAEYAHHLSSVDHKKDTKQFPYWCELCKLGFKRVHPRHDASYLQHLHSKNHQVSLLKFFHGLYCLDCCQAFNTRQTFVAHLRSGQFLAFQRCRVATLLLTVQSSTKLCVCLLFPSR